MTPQYFKAIQFYAEEKCVSTGKLAKKLGVFRQVLGTWNTHEPRLSTMLQVSEILGVTVDEIAKKAREYAETPTDN